MDAIDALDELEELEDFDDLKTKILYSVIVLSHRAARRAVDQLKGAARDALQLPDITAANEDDDDDDDLDASLGGLLRANGKRDEAEPKELALRSTQRKRWLVLAKGVEDAMTDWLRKTATVFDLTSCLEEVEEQLHATLFDFPSLKECAPLREFIISAVRVSW